VTRWGLDSHHQASFFKTKNQLKEWVKMKKWRRKKKEKEDQSTGMRSFFRSHGENYRSGWITMEKPSTSTTWAHVTDCMHISFVCLFFISVSFIFEDQWKSMNNQSSSFWSFREFLALCTHTQIHTQAHTHAQSCTHSFSQQSILCAITFGHWNRSASMETYGERNQETLVLLALVLADSVERTTGYTKKRVE